MVTRPQDRAARKGSPTLFIPLVVCAVGVFAIMALGLYMLDMRAHDATSYTEQVDDATQRPTGAGVIADDTADGTREAALNGQSEGELLDSSAATNLRGDNMTTPDTPDPVNPEQATEQLDELQQEFSEAQNEMTEEENAQN